MGRALLLGKIPYVYYKILTQKLMKNFFLKNPEKNRSPVRNPDNFCRTPEIIFTGLKPDRIYPEKSGRIRSGSSCKSGIRIRFRKIRFYRSLLISHKNWNFDGKKERQKSPTEWVPGQKLHSWICKFVMQNLRTRILCAKILRIRNVQKSEF